MSTPRTKRRPTTAPTPNPASTTAPIVPTVLLAIAAVLAPVFAGVPDETSWTCAIGAIALLAIAWILFGKRRELAAADPPLRLVLLSCAGIVIIAFVSLLFRVVVLQHGSQRYVDPMLHSLAYWAMLPSVTFCGYVVAQRSRAAAYCVLLAITVAGAYVSANGLQDYLIHVRQHIADWREFGPSTPDYFAGYLLITIPISLALFLSAQSEQGRSGKWVYGLALLFQFAALPTTGSRFALVSLAILLLVFAAGLVLALRHGLEFGKPLRVRLAALGIVAVLCCALFGGAVAHRLKASTLASQANSFAFRQYTWRGALKLATRFPIVGAGPGMFVYTYPGSAIVGFTRVAHSGYLQILDDFGPLGELCIICLFAGCIWAALPAVCGIQAAREPEAAANVFDAAVLEQFGPSGSDDRIILVGLVSGIAGALAQNFIDTDWNMTLCGVTMFLGAGLLVGLSRRDGAVSPEADTGRSPVRIATAIAAILLAVACATWSAAGFRADAGDYAAAAKIEPGSADYVGDLGWKVDLAAGDTAAAEGHLGQAIALAPDEVAYRRRAQLEQSSGRLLDALNDIRSGLGIDPNNLSLLLLGAQIQDSLGNHSAARVYYTKMADLEISPFGTVPAIGDVIEYRYVFADVVLGEDAYRIRDYASAANYLSRASAVLRTYADEGGSTNPERQAETGKDSGAQLDQQLQSLFDKIEPELIASREALGQTAQVSSEKAALALYDQKFAHIVADSSQ